MHTHGMNVYRYGHINIESDRHINLESDRHIKAYPDSIQITVWSTSSGKSAQKVQRISSSSVSLTLRGAVRSESTLRRACCCCTDPACPIDREDNDDDLRGACNCVDVFIYSV